MDSSANEVEIALRKKLESISSSISPSHNYLHINMVLIYAKQLALSYDVDYAVLTAASFLHDLGRSDAALHGAQSRQDSIQKARLILHELDLLTPSQIDRILIAIDEHDQPSVTPSSIEGRILKDADFLAGFGALGIVRMAMWSTETGGGLEQFLTRLNEKMPERINGLEFRESRRLAKTQMSFARLFSALVSEEPNLQLLNPRGIYIVLEGVSGSGKDTQADRLQARLKRLKKQNQLAAEPTQLYKELRQVCDAYRHDPWFQAFLLMADRRANIETNVRPALERGEIVISIRSYQSTMVYQGSKTQHPELIELMHQAFVPSPDIVFILDVPSDMAFARCQFRSNTTGRSLGDHENPKALEELRKKYLQLAHTHSAEDYVVIDASKPIDIVSEEIWSYLDKKDFISQETT
jgi:dTMP kinase